MIQTNSLPFHLFIYLLATPGDIWDPTSLTRDQTHLPGDGNKLFKHWTAREVPISIQFNEIFIEPNQQGSFKIFLVCYTKEAFSISKK